MKSEFTLCVFPLLPRILALAWILSYGNNYRGSWLVINKVRSPQYFLLFIIELLIPYLGKQAERNLLIMEQFSKEKENRFLNYSAVAFNYFLFALV